MGRAFSIAMIGSRGIPTAYSGVETALGELCPRLVARGHRVRVYGRSAYRLCPSYEGVEVLGLPSWRTKHLDTLSHVAVSLLHALGSEFEIIHFHAAGPTLLAWLPRLFRRKVVATVQGLDWQRAKWGRGARSVLRVAEAASVRFPHRTIVVSQTLKRHYESKYRVSVEYIPNGVTLPELRHPALIRSAFGLQGGDYILFTGRLVPEKRCHDLLQAFDRLGTNLALVIAGEGSHTDAYVARLKAEASPRVIFTGHVTGDLLAELYSNAFLYVLPSEVEGLSLSLLEAMSYARCVVTSDIPENLEVVGDAGIPFPVRGPEQLAEVLQQLIADPERVSAHGRRARERVANEYGWEAITDQTEAVYRSLAGC